MRYCFVFFFAFASNAKAGMFDNHSLQGFDLGYCLPINFGNTKPSSPNFSIGVGAGGNYYQEESKFWWGTRKEWDLCAGKVFGLQAGDSTDASNGDVVTVYSGNFYEFAYLPLGITLLPGTYFTPGLIWIPSIYIGLGVAGGIEAAREVDYIAISDQLQFHETGPTHYIGQVGPALNVGAQMRFYLIDIFFSGRFNYYLAAPTKFTGPGITIMMGAGISLVK